MKQIDFLDTLCNNPNIHITPLQKGLTNQNFLLTIEKECFVLRVPYADHTQIVNRHHETMALQAIQSCDIDVETLYYDEESGYKLTRYLADAITFQECPYEDKIERTATLMKNFHSLNKQVDEDFQPLERLRLYKNQIQDPFYDLQSFSYILEEVAHMQYKKTLCHNDWVDGNILFTKDKTYLIDYEYAANNDPLFDVMSFLTENNITDASDRKRFYDIYFDNMDNTTKSHLTIWEKFHNLLWCTWAMMMWESRKLPIYKQIAKDKFDALHTKKEK